MSMEDVTKKIERLEVFEEKAGVRLQALSAFFEKHANGAMVWVRGEVHPRAGVQLANDVLLTLTVYDSLERLTGKFSGYFRKNEVFGFDVFEMPLSVPNGDLAKIRLVPNVGTRRS